MTLTCDICDTVVNLHDAREMSNGAYAHLCDDCQEEVQTTQKQTTMSDLEFATYTDEQLATVIQLAERILTTEGDLFSQTDREWASRQIELAMQERENRK